jgi:hypothetical protein
VTPPSDAPLERPISKDECYRMLMNEQLTTGSMLGMYMWATNLGEAKYNFVEELGWDDYSLSLLDA